MRTTRLLTKIFLTNYFVGVFSLIAISVIFYFVIRNALIDRTLNQLQSVNALKAAQVDSYLKEDVNVSEIQRMLLENTGMGSTGESYIVGPDNRLRSASRFFPDRPPQTIKVEGLSNPNHIRTDYRGKKVISFSHELKNSSQKWRIVSEIDLDEAMEPVRTFTIYSAIVTVVCAFLITLVSIKQSANREIKLVRDRTAALIEGQENERKRLTQELHDGIGQLLTAVRLRIEATPLDQSQRKEITELINETIAEVKRISYNAMPGSLVDFGLEAALKGLCDHTAKYSSLKFDFRFIRESDHNLSFDVSVAVFRIVQEGINNILKHALAKNVELHILDKEDSIYILLKDDGKGFDRAEKANAGLGLRSMSERAKLAGGSLEIHSSSSEGTVVEAHIPL